MQRKEYSLLWHLSLVKFLLTATCLWKPMLIYTSWMRFVFSLHITILTFLSGEIRLFPAERLNKEWLPTSTHRLSERPLSFIQENGYPLGGGPEMDERDAEGAWEGVWGPGVVFWTGYWWYKCVCLRKCIKLHTSNSCLSLTFTLYFRNIYIEKMDFETITPEPLVTTEKERKWKKTNQSLGSLQPYLILIG